MGGFKKWITLSYVVIVIVAFLVSIKIKMTVSGT